MVTTKEILDKYSRKLESQINAPRQSSQTYSKEYSQFKKDMIPEISRYEKWAKYLGNIVSLKIKESDRLRVQKYLDTAQLDVTASQAVSLSIVSMLLVFFLSLLGAVSIYLISGNSGHATLFGFLGLIASMFIFYFTYGLPQRLANSWRLRASSEMVPAILYIVIYMKHTPNLERAIEFAAQHLEGPLALDLKKIFYDVEVGKYQTIKQSLDYYLDEWADYAPEFIESFHLIESSLFEPSDSRRITILEKSLEIMLDGVYEKMLKYSREIRSPLTNVYMLGITLPTLSLALLPLASALLGGLIQWHHALIFFNIIIPFFVFYMVSEALLKRPGGCGETSSLEYNPYYSDFVSKRSKTKAILLALPIFIIGLLPFILQIGFVSTSLGIPSDFTFNEIGLTFLGDSKFFDFKCADGSNSCPGEFKVGPFGLGGALFSLFIPLSIMIFFYTLYIQKTHRLIKARDETKKLEEEFTNSLFQLGNRLADGIPAELAIGKVAYTTKSQAASSFFNIANQNINQAGMSLEESIFNKKRGAIIYYPSALIATSMRIMIESAKKGLQVAANSLMSISQYIKNIDKINQRLRDLLAEISSDMKSNMVFLAPLLSGVVVGLGTMIISIVNKLQFLTVDSGQGVGGLGNLSGILDLFDVTQMIPPYFLQIIVGVYIIQIIFILSKALVTVDSGKDVLNERYSTAKYLKAGLILYTITALLSILALTLLASVALSAL